MPNLPTPAARALREMARLAAVCGFVMLMIALMALIAPERLPS